jgi:hypothetical protein
MIPCQLHKKSDRLASEDAYFFNDAVEVRDGKIEMEFATAIDANRLLKIINDRELKFIFAVETKKGQIKKESGLLAIKYQFRLRYLVDEGNRNEHDSYTLRSDDGAYEKTLHEGDDAIPDDEFLTFDFKDILAAKNYSLTVNKSESGPPLILWENIPFIKLIEGFKR